MTAGAFGGHVDDTAHGVTVHGRRTAQDDVDLVDGTLRDATVTDDLHTVDVVDGTFTRTTNGADFTVGREHTANAGGNTVSRTNRQSLDFLCGDGSTRLGVICRDQRNRVIDDHDFINPDGAAGHLEVVEGNLIGRNHDVVDNIGIVANAACPQGVRSRRNGVDVIITVDIRGGTCHLATAFFNNDVCKRYPFSIFVGNLAFESSLRLCHGHRTCGQDDGKGH